MSSEGLHPSVQQFKEFIKKNPHLLKEVKEKRKSLQELFEEWSVLGEEHEQWKNNTDEAGKDVGGKATKEESTAKKSNASDSLGQIMGVLKRLNVEDLQNHLGQFSSVLTNVQNVIQSFQKPSNPPNQRPQDHPFSFRRD
ncbi:YlbD family protein [Bacillus suaedae]|uniref:YlbD family protein n=1 Tax=Halalkalibacter suaedae TaxID=2822140 RepID=A0A940X007_9BACI|nr:YlbD family protein [Bacillus suaedae]MBP3952155.1 YlbD family protein [Bacillus suaedae]